MDRTFNVKERLPNRKEATLALRRLMLKRSINRLTQEERIKVELATRYERLDSELLEKIRDEKRKEQSCQ